MLYGVPWQTYVELRENPENDHLRMTYDRGTLEIMSPSATTKDSRQSSPWSIATWTEELDIPVRSLGQMTCKREDIEKGLEPDDCFYVQNEPRMWHKMEIDLAVDPPPDLAIEVEMSRSSVKKMPIYAALGVPELWRYDGQILRIYELVDGQYQSREASACFPNFPVAKVEEFFSRSARFARPRSCADSAGGCGRSSRTKEREKKRRFEMIFKIPRCFGGSQKAGCYT